MNLPLHLKISQQLRQRIIDGEYPPGEKLPSESKLIEEFKVSRITVRRAIANLINQGLVAAHQGKGVFVTRQEKVIYSLSNPLIFLEEDLQNQGIELAIKNVVFELVSVSEEVKTILNLPSSQATAYLQKKILLMNDVPGCVDVTYILPDIGAMYGEELKQQMTFSVLARHKIIIERVEAILECTCADYETSQYLDVPLGNPLLVYRHTAYTKDNLAIVHGKSISRGDRFCYSVNLKTASL